MKELPAGMGPFEELTHSLDTHGRMSDLLEHLDLHNKNCGADQLRNLTVRFIGLSPCHSDFNCSRPIR